MLIYVHSVSLFVLLERVQLNSFDFAPLLGKISFHTNRSAQNTLKSPIIFISLCSQIKLWRVGTSVNLREALVFASPCRARPFPDYFDDSKLTITNEIYRWKVIFHNDIYIPSPSWRIRSAGVNKRHSGSWTLSMYSNNPPQSLPHPMQPTPPMSRWLTRHKMTNQKSPIDRKVRPGVPTAAWNTDGSVKKDSAIYGSTGQPRREYRESNGRRQGWEGFCKAVVA